MLPIIYEAWKDSRQYFILCTMIFMVIHAEMGQGYLIKTLLDILTMSTYIV